MKRRLIVLILSVATMTMIVPISASATFFTPTLNGGKAGWEAVVGSFAAVADLPGTTDGQPINAFTNIALPQGGSFRFGVDLVHYNVPSGWPDWSSPPPTEVLASFNLVTNSIPPAYIANGNFNSGSASVSAFGFEMEAKNNGIFSIGLFMTDNTTFWDEIYNDTTTPNGAAFFGWAGVEVASFTAICYYPSGSPDPMGFAMGNFVEGVAPVPEPATMLLLGSGLLGLWGARKKFKN